MVLVFISLRESVCGQSILRWPICALKYGIVKIMLSFVLCGLARSQPNMQILLNPIFDELKHLNIIGFPLDTGPDGIKTVRAKVLFCVADLIAKAKILNMKQFNGHCSCPTCIHPGEHDRSHLYLPNNTYLLRTPDRIERAIRKVNKYGIAVEGIKGISTIHIT